jgi:hypothetical protein
MEVGMAFHELLQRQAIPVGFEEVYEYVEWPRGVDGSLKDLRRCRIPLQQNAIVDDMESWIPEDQRDRWIPVRDCAEVRGIDRDLQQVVTLLEEKFSADEGPWPQPQSRRKETG